MPASSSQPFLQRFIGSRAKRMSTRLDQAALVKNGLPVGAVAVLGKTIEAPRQELSRLIRIPERTLARRSVLRPDESERVLRLGLLVQRAIDVFGTEARAKDWLRHPQFGLGGLVPLEVADTEPGAREVEELLGRIEHGVVA